MSSFPTVYLAGHWGRRVRETSKVREKQCLGQETPWRLPSFPPPQEYRRRPRMQMVTSEVGQGWIPGPLLITEPCSRRDEPGETSQPPNRRARSGRWIHHSHTRICTCMNIYTHMEILATRLIVLINTFPSPVILIHMSHYGHFA